MLFWIALAVFVVAIGVGLALAAVRGYELFRAAKATQRELAPTLEHIAATSLEIQRHLEQAQAGGMRAQASVDRLLVSVKRLQIQLAAVREAQRQLDRLLWFLPGR